MNVEVEKIRFKNVNSFGNNFTEFIFKKGCNLVVGKNGDGKSSFLLDVLSFNWFGKPYRSVTIQELINNKNKKNLLTESYFKIDQDRYIISRGLKPNILKIEKNGEEVSLESTKNLIQEFIDSTLGCNHSLFKQVISLSILNNKPFLTLDSLEKKNILESIFNIKVFGRMLKTLKRNLSATKNSLELKEKEQSILKESLETLVSQIKSLDKSKKEFEEEKNSSLKSLEAKLEAKKLELEKINTSIKKLNFEEKEIDSTLKKILQESKDKHLKSWMVINNQIGSKKEELRSIQETQLNYEDYFGREYSELSQLLSSSNKEIEVAKSNAENKKKISDKDFQSKKETLNKEIQKLEFEVEKLDKEKSFLTKEYLEKNLSEVLEKKKIITSNKLQIENLNKEITKLETEEGTCSYCQQVISKEHRDKEISSRNEKINLLGIEIHSVISEIETIIFKHIREKKSEIESKFIKLKEDIDKSKLAISTEENLLKMRYSAIEADLKSNLVRFESKKQEICDGYVKILIENLNKEINELEEKDKQNHLELESVKSKLEELEKEEKEYTQKLNDHKNLIIQYDSINMVIDNTLEEIEKVKNREFNVDIEDLKKLFEGKKKVYQDLKSEIKNLENKIKIQKSIEELLDENGIKKFFFSRLIPKLNESINQYLNFFDLPLKFTFNDLFEETILEVGNIERSYKSFSGGEQFRLNLSIILSFMDLNRLINNFHPNIVIYDELLDVGGDSEVVESVLEKLKEITDKNKMCTYIISHREISESVWIDNVIRVKKQSGFSQILA